MSLERTNADPFPAAHTALDHQPELSRIPPPESASANNERRRYSARRLCRHERGGPIRLRALPLPSDQHASRLASSGFCGAIPPRSRHRVSSSLLGPAVPSFRALSERLKFTVRRQNFQKILSFKRLRETTLPGYPGRDVTNGSCRRISSTIIQ